MENKHYVVVTNFVDGTSETNIYYTIENQTVENVIETIMEKNDQFYFSENEQEPKVKSIIAYEITKYHQYDNLDESFKLYKEKFLQDKESIKNEKIVKPKRKSKKSKIVSV